MEVGLNQELQGLVPQGDAVPLLYRAGLKRFVHDLPQKIDSAHRAHHFDLRVQLQQFGGAARMVRLSVIHHKVVDLLNVCDSLHLLQVFIEKLFLCGFDEGSLFTPLYHIGIVGGTKFRLHNNIEHAQIAV